MGTDGKIKAETSVGALIAGLQSYREFTRRFASEEDGVMTYFSFYLLFMMLLIGGIGVDLMQNEMTRTKLQATVDRAVLAAADLDQDLEPQAVVNDYFNKAGLSDFLSTVSVDDGLNYRIVQAQASMTSKTRFMKFMGVNELPVPAVGTAEERMANVEISMVLDISGSMGNNSKMENMQDAAGIFVDTVLQEENENLISINLVPYTAQVNAGETIFDMIATADHPYSYCIDFEEADFDVSTLDFDLSYDHMQHFEAGWWWNGSHAEDAINNPGCPKRDYEEIVAYSQDPIALKNTINQYNARANTSIHIGMKWGVAMLDPSFRPITQELNLNLEADPNFASRPADYSDSETLKTVILMTDGQNVDTWRIQDWYYANGSHYYHWSRYPLFWYLNNFVGGSWDNWRYMKYSSTQADTMLDNICTAAKDQGIIVWSIGFEVTDFSANIMRDCASTPSHFFRVEGVEISEAFEAIAKQINQLRLTQ